MGEPRELPQRRSGRRDRLSHHHRNQRILKKLPTIGKDLDDYSLETVKMFHEDSSPGELLTLNRMLFSRHVEP